MGAIPAFIEAGAPLGTKGANESLQKKKLAYAYFGRKGEDDDFIGISTLLLHKNSGRAKGGKKKNYTRGRAEVGGDLTELVLPYGLESPKRLQ